MRVRYGRLVLVPLVVLAVVVGACGPNTPALARLDDPSEILEEAVRTTAELQYVHLRLEMETKAQNLGAPDMTIAYTADMDVDLTRREFHALIEGSMGGFGGPMRAQALLVGNDIFMKTEATLGATEPAKWMRTSLANGSDPRDGVPDNEVVAAALHALLDDASIKTSLVGMEDCASGTCYHVRLTIPPDVTWRLVGGALFGAPGGGLDQPVDPSVPEIAIDVLVDEGTRRLITLSSSFVAAASAVDLRVTLSEHDREVRFVPPPIDQVQELGGFGPGGLAPGGGADDVDGVLEEVGSEVWSPAPSSP